MKKTIKLILIIFLFTMIILPTTIYATTITKTEYSNNKITVTGTGEASETVQIVLFDLENNVKYLTTTKTDSNGKFEITLPEISGLSDGTYTIKTGNYNGTNTATSNVEVKTVNNQEQNNTIENQEKDDTPKTGENAIFYLPVIMLFSGIVIITTMKLNKESK